MGHHIISIIWFDKERVGNGKGLLKMHTNVLFHLHLTDNLNSFLHISITQKEDKNSTKE